MLDLSQLPSRLPKSNGRRPTNCLQLLASLTCLIAAISACAQQSVTYTQVVNRADPGLRWTPPAPIAFGQPLTSTQLSATASVPGTFAYAPPAGEVLQPGSQSLAVVFTPTNPGYLSSSLTVPLIVTPPAPNFSFGTAAPDAGLGTLTLSPSAPLTLALSVAPVGDFHQPITFSCTTLRREVHCDFSPDIVHPANAPVQVNLFVSYRPLPTGNGPQTSLEKTDVGVLLGGLIFFTRRRRKRLTAESNHSRRRVRSFLLVLPLCTVLSGCGYSSRSGPASPSLQSHTLVIRADSGGESHLLEVNLLLGN